jgi:hypothetical protein
LLLAVDEMVVVGVLAVITAVLVVLVGHFPI